MTQKIFSYDKTNMLLLIFVFWKEIMNTSTWDYAQYYVANVWLNSVSSLPAWKVCNEKWSDFVRYSSFYLTRICYILKVSV